MRKSERLLVENPLSLDLARLHREGPGEGTWFAWHWELGGKKRISAAICLQSDRLEINARGVRYCILLKNTQVGFSGFRRWLICPGCRRGCRVVYSFTRLWKCRRCHGLRYSSQYEDETDRVERQIWRLLAKLGDEQLPASFFDRTPTKPKHMHWSTYWTLCQRHNELRDRWAASVFNKFKIDRAVRPGSSVGREQLRNEAAMSGKRLPDS